MVPIGPLASLNAGAIWVCLPVPVPWDPVQTVFLVCLTWVSLQPLLGGWVKGEAGLVVKAGRSPTQLPWMVPVACRWGREGGGGSLCLWNIVRLLGHWLSIPWSLLLPVSTLLLRLPPFPHLSLLTPASSLLCQTRLFYSCPAKL